MSDGITLELARPPTLELRIDENARTTADRSVVLSHSFPDQGNGTPVAYRASESEAVLQATAFQPYTATPTFELSGPAGASKRVYMQVGALVGEGPAQVQVVSPVVSDTIALVQETTIGIGAEPLPVPPPDVSVGISAVQELQDYVFQGGTVAASGAAAGLSQYVSELRSSGTAVGVSPCRVAENSTELVLRTPPRESFTQPEGGVIFPQGCYFALGPLPNPAFQVRSIDAFPQTGYPPADTRVLEVGEGGPGVETLPAENYEAFVSLRRIVIRGPAGDWTQAFQAQ